MLIASVLLSCLSVASSVPDDRPVVRTNYGKIRGRVIKSYGGREFLAFNGIPYAKPPLGELRFKAPVSPSKYDGILDGSKDSEDCFQVDMTYNQYYSERDTWLTRVNTSQYVGSEDCLYLNVYTPSLEGGKLPVMVFIHGGAFMVGSGAMALQGPHFFMDHDVIIVTINYRLEILGFLRADDSYLSGNMGLKDQSAALRWIKENIESFNGLSNSITIFGESAGAASVNFQLLAPRNKGVFQRAISQSGFVHCPWPLQTLDRAKELAQTLATTLGCPTEPHIMIKCLQDKSVLEIYQAYSTFDSDLPYYMNFKPVLENEVAGAFVTRRSFSQGSDIPWIIGITSGEGIMFLGERLLVGDTDLSELNKTYEELLPRMFYMSSCPRAKEAAHRIKQYYLADRDFSMDNVHSITDLFSDALFNFGFHKAGQKHGGRLYRYLYSHVGERTFAQDLRHLQLGVNHGDELHLQFYSTHYFEDGTLNDIDAEVSKKFINLWVNFAKYGDPTPEGSEIKWPEASKSSKYLEIATDGLKLGQDLFKERFCFWEELYSSYKPAKDEL